MKNIKKILFCALLALLLCAPMASAQTLENGEYCFINAQCISGWCVNSMCINNPCADAKCELQIDCFKCEERFGYKGDCVATDCGIPTEEFENRNTMYATIAIVGGMILLYILKRRKII